MKQTTQKTHLAHEIELTESVAQYDDSIKGLLGDKQVFARIAKHRVEEFRDYDVETIMDCIEGEPEIATVPLYPGKRKTEMITGMNTESIIQNEGEVTFDVRAYMRTPDGDRIKVIVNLEGQLEYYPGYHFEPRAVFYCARMLSEQKDREFAGDNYDDLKKVYSIWIFFEASQKDSDTITEFSLTKKDVYGPPVRGGKYDYLSISFIRLPIGGVQESKDKLIEMLSILFSNSINAQEKKETLKEKYNMKMTRSLEGGIRTMCNVGEGLAMRAIKEGKKEGIVLGEIKSLVETYQEFGKTKEETIQKLMQKFGMSEEVAEENISKYWV